MKALALHIFFEIKSGLRKKQQFFLNFLFPLGFFLMMGAVMPQLNPLFLEDMIPAMIIFSVMSSTFLGIPDQMVSGRTSGVFRAYKVNGVPKSVLLALPIMSSIINSIIVSLIILFVSPLLFKAPVPLNFSLFPPLLLTLLCCGGISLLIGITASGTRAAAMLSQLLFIPSMLIGGLMIPYGMLPPSIKNAALFLPSTHSMNLIELYAYGRTSELSPVHSLIFLGGTGAAALILSCILFRWDNRQRDFKKKPESP